MIISNPRSVHELRVVPSSGPLQRPNITLNVKQVTLVDNFGVGSCGLTVYGPRLVGATRLPVQVRFTGSVSVAASKVLLRRQQLTEPSPQLLYQRNGPRRPDTFRGHEPYSHNTDLCP